MFTFIIATNRVTKEIDRTIDALLRTKTDNDSIILLNYNNYNIKYRSVDGISYRHIKQSRKNAINSVLPKNGNVVIFDDSIIATDTLVKDLYKHYDFKKLSTLRVDTISGGGKFVESDYRIGSYISPKLFTHFVLLFNTALLSSIGETPEETANIALEWNIPLDMISSARVLSPSHNNKKVEKIGMTILIPSLNYKYINIIKNNIRPNDRLYEFDSSPRGMTKVLNQKISESPNQCIVIVNPESKMDAATMLSKVRGYFDNNRCMIFDLDDGITNDAWLSIPKSRYSFTHKTFRSVNELQSSIISYNNQNLVSYIDTITVKDISDIIPGAEATQRYISGDMISIIIPFMYNGDRWPLFEASIESLYNHTKGYDNIEIIVHETAPKRYIDPHFIKKYELVYLFSEYNGLFHRAWNLNVVARYVASGNTFVFFDGDLIIDDKWVQELIRCDKSKPYIGWGEMVNLNKKGTDIYIRTRKLTDNVERVRIPDGHAAAAGINVIPREIFFNIGGWPESYKGYGYGGEDNSLSFKMIALDMYDKSMKSWR